MILSNYKGLFNLTAKKIKRVNAFNTFLLSKMWKSEDRSEDRTGNDSSDNKDDSKSDLNQEIKSGANEGFTSETNNSVSEEPSQAFNQVSEDIQGPQDLDTKPEASETTQEEDEELELNKGEPQVQEETQKKTQAQEAPQEEAQKKTQAQEAPQEETQKKTQAQEAQFKAQVQAPPVIVVSEKQAQEERKVDPEWGRLISWSIIIGAIVYFIKKRSKQNREKSEKSSKFSLILKLIIFILTGILLSLGISFVCNKF